MSSQSSTLCRKRNLAFRPSITAVMRKSMLREVANYLGRQAKQEVKSDSRPSSAPSTPRTIKCSAPIRAKRKCSCKPAVSPARRGLTVSALTMIIITNKMTAPTSETQSTFSIIMESSSSKRTQQVGAGRSNCSQVQWLSTRRR